MKVTQYQNGSVISSSHYDYSDGKITEIRWYSSGNFLAGVTKYGYFSNGLLLSLTNYNNSQSRIDNFTFVYDNDNRLIHQKYQRKYISEQYTITYTYNNDNTITADRAGADPSTKTFYLNNEGLIYKEVSEVGDYEIIFDGKNPVSANDDITLKTFEYDETHNRALLNDRNGKDHYMPNNVLRANSLNKERNSTADKYLIRESIESELNFATTYEYSFNDAGLPTSKKEFENGILKKETEYKYQ
ncbi:hypothetical protein [Flavobacterium beibuense]|nr:hypothetical protein [Flavobacterium beibuense]